MRDDGIKHALAFMTSGYSSYSGCRQYRENIAAGQAEVGEGAPKVDKLRVFYNHPGFIEASADRVREGLAEFSPEEIASVRVLVTAHSIPCSMAETSAAKRNVTIGGRSCRADGLGVSVPKPQWPAHSAMA